MVFQVEQELYERAQRAAKAERRSVSNWLAITIERAVEDKPRAEAELPVP
jgi:predicted HicB family RNase H-like nuclease